MGTVLAVLFNYYKCMKFRGWYHTIGVSFFEGKMLAIFCFFSPRFWRFHAEILISDSSGSFKPHGMTDPYDWYIYLHDHGNPVVPLFKTPTSNYTLSKNYIVNMEFLQISPY